MTHGLAQPRLPLRSAMTLIETLAVIVILSMVTGALGLSLTGNNRSAQARAAMARWRDLDAQARIAAQVEGAVQLKFDEDGRGIALRAVRNGEVLGTLRWPDGFEGSMATVDDQTASLIEFDSRGRSVDYAMMLRDLEYEGDGNAFTARVCGLTGWFVRETQP